MNKTLNSLIIVTVLLQLSGCGDQPGERAVSGAGIGAGVGAVGGAILGGDAVDGALIGGALGGATGGLTKSKDINLGKPIWK